MSEAEESLPYRERSAAGPPAGLLVLHHGRGTDETDLLGLAQVLDPAGRLQVVAPRAPLRLARSPGYHWYVVPRVGYPDRDTFHTSYARLSAFHDQLWSTTAVPPERTILAGFSMGSVMSYATGLGPGRPRPAGIMAFSGFVPTVEGWRPELETRAGLPVLIAHGNRDPVIEIAFARQARDLLLPAGLEVEYLESDIGHSIDPQHVERAARWIDRLIPD
jgi:phospholipase/carboxylesterase